MDVIVILSLLENNYFCEYLTQPDIMSIMYALLLYTNGNSMANPLMFVDKGLFKKIYYIHFRDKDLNLIASFKKDDKKIDYDILPAGWVIEGDISQIKNTYIIYLGIDQHNINKKPLSIVNGNILLHINDSIEPIGKTTHVNNIPKSNIKYYFIFFTLFNLILFLLKNYIKK